jgi:hypothetical protein
MEPPVRPGADGIDPVYTPGVTRLLSTSPDQGGVMRCVLFGLMLATAVVAASVDGKWKASFTSPDGQTRESVFQLRSEGEKLTGTVAGARGEATIENGTVKGELLSFTVKRNFGDREVTIRYDGKLSGDTIDFKVSFGQDRTFDMKAVRQ